MFTLSVIVPVLFYFFDSTSFKPMILAIWEVHFLRKVFHNYFERSFKPLTASLSHPPFLCSSSIGHVFYFLDVLEKNPGTIILSPFPSPILVFLFTSIGHVFYFLDVLEKKRGTIILSSFFPSHCFFKARKPDPCFSN